MKPKPRKKLVVINSDLYVRNYLQTDALSALDDETLYFLASQDVTLREELEAKPNFLGYFKYDDTLFHQYMFLSNVLMLRHQDRSKTFGYRYRRLSARTWDRLSPEQITQTKTYRNLARFLPNPLALSITKFSKFSKMSAKEKQYIWMWLWGRPGFASLYSILFQQFVKPNASLTDKIRQLQPDLVLFPSSAIDPCGNDLVRLQRQLGYQTFYIVDNWDNLSSKSIYINPPDYLGVWGQQSVEHAEQIHHIPANRVFKIGTPRFESYFSTVQNTIAHGTRPESPYPFNYILYVGCCIEFDEISSLKALDTCLVEHNQHPEQANNPLKLVYRPHPWRLKRQCFDQFQADDFQYVILDTQLEAHYYNPQAKGLFQPALEYYPRLLSNAHSVIGPLTTMLVEASIFRKRILAIAYDDGIHLSSPSYALANYRHFEGLTEIPGWRFSYTFQAFQNDFTQFLNHTDHEIDWDMQAQKIQYYLYHSQTPYPLRLKQCVDTIFKNSPT